MRSLPDPTGVLLIGADPTQRRQAVRGSESPLVDVAARDIASPPGGNFSDPMLMGGNYLWVDTAGTVRIKATPPTSDMDGTPVGGGGGGAPTTAEYLVAVADATLTAERVTTDTATVAWDHGTAAQAKANVPDAGITNAKLRNSGALSVIGRNGNSVGVPADIAAVAGTGAVLRENGFTIGFGLVAEAGLADNAVSDLKLRDSAARSVIGRSANSVGDPTDISASAASDAVLRESGGFVGFGTIATAGIANDAVTNAKLANMSANVIKGRITAGAGDPEDLTAADVRTIINVADGANNYVHPNHSGDVTSVADGAQTIAADAVTFAKMQNIATARLLGRLTAGAGDPEELTGTQATTLLDVFTAALKGLVPLSGGGTANFLRADGTWTAPTASAADPLTRSYLLTSFTVPTGKYIMTAKRIQLATTGRATLEGTARWSHAN